MPSTQDKATVDKGDGEAAAGRPDPGGGTAGRRKRYRVTGKKSVEQVEEEGETDEKKETDGKAESEDKEEQKQCKSRRDSQQHVNRIHMSFLLKFDFQEQS